tara:strand:+ start:3600 stop:4913 length:1314 start_codon:yes stop_codon:yes gene_type:complete
MSFSIKTYGLTGGAPAVILGNIFAVSSEYLGTPDETLVASSLGVYPYLQSINTLAGLSDTSEPDYTKNPINFPVMGYPGTFPGGREGSTSPFHTVDQHIIAYPIAPPPMNTSGHGFFCDYNCGFGFGLESYLSGIQVRSGVDPAFGFSPYEMVDPITEDDMREQVAAPFVGTVVSYDTHASIAPFAFSTKPFSRSLQIKDYIDFSETERIQFVPFYFKSKITAYRGFWGETEGSFDASTSRSAATSVLAESNVRPWEHSARIFQDTANDVTPFDGLPGGTIAAETGEEGFEFYTGGVSGTASAYLSRPYVASGELLAVNVIEDAIADAEMALYTAKITNNDFSAYKNNLGARFISISHNYTRAVEFIAARVAYISATLEATEISETPKAFRVKKQISPDMHKRDYSTFNDDRADVTSTVTYSGRSGGSAGSSGGSSY